MGLIKPTELPNGNVALEIVYGGVEAPFGGIDASMPPPYIDPKCEVEVLGFVIVKGCLVAVSMQPYEITFPDLGTSWISPNTARMAGFGSFYSDNLGYVNFIVLNGALQEIAGVSTAQVAMLYWPARNLLAAPAAQILTVTQTTGTAATAATATWTIGVVANQGGTGTLRVTATVNGIVSPQFTEATPEFMAADLVNWINATPTTLVTAASTVITPGVQVVVTLTSIVTGVAGNSYTLSDRVDLTGSTRPAGPWAIIMGTSNFSGGTEATTFPQLTAPIPISYQSVGENLYIAGPGNAMFKFQVNPSIDFSVLQQYVGAAVLKKFGGYLIGLGIFDGAGTFIQSAQMVMAWSANQTYGQWNPTDIAGNITGAGFMQLADISDYLSGGFVSSSVLTILRANGISFATLTGLPISPFDVNHVDMAENSEGCPSLQGSAQYNQYGFFLGNSNIYQYAQGLTPIGDKVKSLIFPLLTPGNSSSATATQFALARAMALYINGEEVIFFCLYIPPYMFMYNVHNATWTRLNLTPPAETTEIYLSNFLAANLVQEGYSKQSLLTVGTGITSPPDAPSYNFYTLQEYIDGDSQAEILFPQEEVMFGRDVTVESLLASVAGTPGLELQFNILNQDGNVVLTKNLILGGTAAYNKFVQYPIYFADESSGYVSITIKSPQLQLFVIGTPVGISKCKIAKVTMFASFDSKQKPT